MRIDGAFLTDALVTLVSTDSVNPSLARGGAGEEAVAALTAGWMQDLGMEVTVLEGQPGRPSVVGVLKGRGGGRSLMLNAHFDTVGVDEMSDPFSAEIRDGRLYGRGAYDMKGSLAACLAAVEALQKAGAALPGDLLLTAVADEEYASLGTEEVLEHFRAHGAIVTEPTDLEICLAHKGFLWLEIETEGRAAHGSQHQLGVDANLHMGRVLHELDRLASELLAGRAHPLVGPPSLHAALIEGGTGLSTYAERCTLKVERRTVPGEDVDSWLLELESLLEQLSEADPQFQAGLRILLRREPFEVPADAAVVTSLERAAESALGTAPSHRGENPWMDSALLSRAGIETVVIGPSGAGAHSAEEWVDLESVFQLAGILARAAEIYCGPEGP